MSTKFTVGDLRRALAAWDDEDELAFAGGVTFYRVKAWDDRVALIEFNETQAELSPKTQKTILVAFCRQLSSDKAASVVYIPRI